MYVCVVLDRLYLLLLMFYLCMCVYLFWVFMNIWECTYMYEYIICCLVIQFYIYIYICIYFFKLRFYIEYIYVFNRLIVCFYMWFLWTCAVSLWFCWLMLSVNRDDDYLLGLVGCGLEVQVKFILDYSIFKVLVISIL